MRPKFDDCDVPKVCLSPSWVASTLNYFVCGQRSKLSNYLSYSSCSGHFGNLLLGCTSRLHFWFKGVAGLGPVLALFPISQLQQNDCYSLTLTGWNLTPLNLFSEIRTFFQELFLLSKSTRFEMISEARTCLAWSVAPTTSSQF